MRNFTLRQKATIFVGLLGITFNTLGLMSAQQPLSFLAVFLGRLAAALFAWDVGGFRWWICSPIVITTVNVFINSTELIFVEYLVQSLMYQFTAYQVFKNNA